MLPSDVIRERGWCQWMLYSEKGNVCIRGAINTFLQPTQPASQQRIVFDEAFWEWDKVVAHVLGTNPQPHDDEGTPTGDTGVVRWNNALDRTKEEVIEVLEKVEYERGLRVKMEDLIEPFKEREMALKVQNPPDSGE